MTELLALRVPFVHATVVRAQEPTSAQPGDDAIVLADGTIEGFVGGQCAEGSVRSAALGALLDGKTVLLRVLPDGKDGFPESPGAQVVVNPCLSGGAMEIFLEPLLPPPLVEVVGDTPIANAIAAQCETLGFSVGRGLPGGFAGDPTAVLIASHGKGEEESIRAALDAGVRYVGLVSGRHRGAAMLDEMALAPAEQALVHTHVGLDIGASTAPEIALSVLAEVVRAVRVEGLTAPIRTTQPATVVDPVCGMTVIVGADTPSLAVDGVMHWFCGPGCRAHFAEHGH
jgi:xanthine dehydrogenase accessory factor